jgi:hypothetical protein
VQFDPSLHLSEKSWQIFQAPFPWVYVQDIFPTDIYRQLSMSFQNVIHGEGVKQSVRQYDATIRRINTENSDLFFPFFDRVWIETLAAAFGAKPTSEIDAALHAHPAGSRAGWIHNDFNPGYFYPSSAGLTFSNDNNCDYRTGSGVDSDLVAKRMRHITIIFYVANDGWSPDQGGETGIYKSSSQTVDQPTARIAPINNSLFAFECSPHSYHAFMGTKGPRNSLTIWLHRPIENAREEWPYHDPVHWR